MTPAAPRLGPVLPILRVFDVALARRFYLDGLGFSVRHEHRFDDAAPVFLIVERDEAVLALSEHHGDGTPGTAVWLPVTGLEALRDRILADASIPLRPGIDAEAPVGPTMTLLDPFGNELRLCEPLG